MNRPTISQDGQVLVGGAPPPLDEVRRLLDDAEPAITGPVESPAAPPGTTDTDTGTGTGTGTGTEQEDAGPATGTEAALCEVLAEVAHLDRVPVDRHFFDDLGADSLVMAHFCARVRKRADLPSVSMKDIYRHPTIRSLATALEDAALSPVERSLSALLGEVAHLDRVPVDRHFFDDLGADSLVMAHFCARVRKRADLPSVSMKDIYRHPTIRGLATALAAATPATDVQRAGVDTQAAADTATAVLAPAAATTGRAKPVGTPGYVLCGVLQLLIFLGYTYLTALVTVRGYEWITAGSGLLDSYVRTVVYAGSSFLGLCLLPIVAKWVLVGRWKPREIRIWSLTYVRFWFVKTLIRSNPLVRFSAGSPIYLLYLRALGARVGRGVAIFSRSVPVCTDLLTIGDGTVIGKDVLFSGYRASAGVIRTGTVTFGADVFVSESTVVDIDTSMGDGAQLGHRSSLYPGQEVPAGERWHGSPGRRTEVDYRTVGAGPRTKARRIVYPVLQMLWLLFAGLPLAVGGLSLLLTVFPRVGALLDAGPLALDQASFYRDAAAISAVLFFGSIMVSLIYVVSVPRLLGRVLRPDRDYPLYGWYYTIHRTIARTTNRKFLTNLFGDSSAIVHYLRAIGYDLGNVEQTGSNFGTGLQHESPFLTTIGRGTMAADGLSINNADFSSTSFRLSRTTIGARNFLGNAVAYPSRSRTGDNVLLGTKVLVPIDGPVREDIGLLGSPSFEIPRSVERDLAFDHLRTESDFRQRLRAKNRHNLRTAVLFLLQRWVGVFALILIVQAGLEFYDAFGAAALAASSLLGLLFTTLYGAVVERAATRFRPLTPRTVSIYDRLFWQHERFWKMTARPGAFNGTPFKGMVWRLLGARVGKRLFDDGFGMPERSLVTIGDHCTVNHGSAIQAHSQEDGAFKSDRISIGNDCTIGVGAWVHYGVTMGDGVELATDSFLMKGEDVPSHSRWGGNPAEELQAGTPPPDAGAGRHRRSRRRRRDQRRVAALLRDVGNAT